MVVAGTGVPISTEIKGALHQFSPMKIKLFFTRSIIQHVKTSLSCLVSCPFKVGKYNPDDSIRVISP